MKFALAFTAVVSFAAGFITATTVGDVQAKANQCERNTENAERYAKVIAHALNGGTIESSEHTAKCRVRKKEDE